MSNKVNRRKFIQTTSLATAGVFLSPSFFASSNNNSKIKAIAFDGFPIFDPRPIFKYVKELLPEKGGQFIETWKTKQFEYQWLRVCAGKYKDFWKVTQDALDFADKQHQTMLSNEQKILIMQKYKEISTWPDVIDSLKTLKNQGLKLGFLSNMTSDMLNQGIANSKTEKLFDFIISTDDKQIYKPSPNAYQMGIDVLKLKKEEILFVAFASWDMTGAKWFGYPTYWVNRLNSQIDNLDAVPDGTSSDLIGLVNFVTEYNKK